LHIYAVFRKIQFLIAAAKVQKKDENSQKLTKNDEKKYFF